MLSIRKIGAIGRTYRHLNRYRQILAVLFKYGYGDLIELLKIDQYIEIGLQLISRKPRERLDKLSRAEKVRMALEELGPTYIKLGQVLSTRPDLVPVDFIRELSKLQDKVPPCDFDSIRQVVTRELKQPPEDLFDYFDSNPMASASIGQVYKARLKDGDEVAVKVQRPGIRKIIEVDLEIMLHLATLMERHVEEMALHRPVKIVEEFARTLEKEIDYDTEAANMDRFARLYLREPTVCVPKVYHELTSARVLTMEFISGIKVSHVARLEEEALDLKIITARGADLILSQVFVHGFFHADPHPGNIFVLPNNNICLVDFGMVGAVDRQTREDFVELIDSVVHRNETRAAQIILRLTIWEDEPEFARLEKEVADFMGRHLYKPLKEIQVARLLQNLLDLTSRHRLRIPEDIFLMMKAFAAVEGVAMMLDPDFDMVAQARPFIEQVKLARFEPDRIASDVVQLTAELSRFVHTFPRDLLEITRKIRKQKLSIQLAHQGLDRMLATHDQISNRIAFSVIIAALIIGSALIVISKTPPFIYGISLIGIIGFLAAALMGIWLLIAILRKGRL